MTKSIHNWEELSRLRPNTNYRIEMEPDDIGAWIRPTRAYLKKVKNEPMSKHSVYLNTHVFEGDNKKWATEMLNKHGFDVVVK